MDLGCHLLIDNHNRSNDQPVIACLVAQTGEEVMFWVEINENYFVIFNTLYL